MVLESRDDELNPFRAEALAQGIASADIERWITANARPCATLSVVGDGPVVGRCGGPFAVPADEPTPPAPLIASIDCAAIPKEATDLPLPADGHLLFFGFPEEDEDGRPLAKVVYVPVGVTREEREEDPWFREDPDMRRLREQYSDGELRLYFDVSLPGLNHTASAEDTVEDQLPRIWTSFPAGELQIGGYPKDELGGEYVPHLAGAPDNPEDWVLLADWHPGFEGKTGYVLHWGIRRQDLAARRFDRAEADYFWNP